MCQSCYENLHNSYRFMLKVRDSEKKKEENQPPVKKSKKESHVEQCTEEAIEQINEDEISLDTIEELSCGNVSEEEEEVLNEPRIVVEKVVEEIRAIQDYVTFNQYSLECREENNRTFVSVKLGKIDVKKSECKNFDYKFPTHKDLTAIYSCLYCIKAFGNLELLMNHLCSCHLCKFCLETFQEYNKVTNHVKIVHQKSNLNCPFCLKTFNSTTFRSHIKKEHLTELPQYFHVLAAQ